MSTIKSFRPNIYDLFECDVEACNETCCSHWTINITRDDYKKYIEHESLKDIAQSYIKDNKIELKPDFRCPFLDNQNMCDVYKSLGEKELSKTCRTYPRIRRDVMGYYEESLELSCSVVVDLLENQLEFYESPLEDDFITSTYESVDFKTYKTRQEQLTSIWFRDIEIPKKINETFRNLGLEVFTKPDFERANKMLAHMFETQLIFVSPTYTRLLNEMLDQLGEIEFSSLDSIYDEYILDYLEDNHMLFTNYFYLFLFNNSLRSNAFIESFFILFLFHVTALNINGEFSLSTLKSLMHSFYKTYHVGYNED